MGDQKYDELKCESSIISAIGLKLQDSVTASKENKMLLFFFLINLTSKQEDQSVSNKECESACQRHRGLCF